MLKKTWLEKGKTILGSAKGNKINKLKITDPCINVNFFEREGNSDSDSMTIDFRPRAKERMSNGYGEKKR